jgi:hypothetical protein
LFIKERVELARKQSAFWHNYKWLNPATQEIEPQEAYCDRLNNIVVCGGAYGFWIERRGSHTAETVLFTDYGIVVFAITTSAIALMLSVLGLANNASDTF